MKEMTDGEADHWDEFFTQNPPAVDPAKKGGYFTRQRELLDVLDEAAADYILARAVSSNKLLALPPCRVLDIFSVFYVHIGASRKKN
jgi:hypothetical protein